MALNYTKRLQNLEGRRNPDKIVKSLNEGLSARNYSGIGAILTEGSKLKYLSECMSPIEQAYNDSTILASENVKKHLEREFNLHFSRAYRTQGSVMTNTNIKSYSDIDLLAVIDRYHYQSPSIPNPDPYTASDPDVDIKEMRKQATKIMQDQYDLVNTTGAKCISIFNKSLNRKVDVVFAFWYNSEKYDSTANEYYRGVYLYDFQQSKRELDFPFAHIENVNDKGNVTYDRSRRVIRLLKSLKADSDGRIDLTSFQLTTIVHDIENTELNSAWVSDIEMAKTSLRKIAYLIANSEYRKNISSPAGTQKPLYDDNIVGDLRELHTDLAELVADCEYESNSSKTRMFAR